MTAQDTVVAALRFGSLVVLGGYAVALSYRCGLVRRVLPTAANTRLEAVVESVKSCTEPMGDASRFVLVRRHLVRAYGWTSTGMLALGAGTLFFHRCSAIPVVLPIATTFISALLLLGLPRQVMRPAARIACFYGACLSVGYTLGPLGWIAQDSLLVFVLLIGSTMAGLCVPLVLTRGMVSYLLSAQLLSTALSLAIVTTPRGGGPEVRAQPGVAMIMNADINVLLTLQLISNLGINALHTLPTIYHFVSFDGSESALVAGADPLKEACCMCGGLTYLIYRVAQSATRRLMKHILADQPGRTDHALMGGILAPQRDPAGLASGIISAITMMLVYVKAVSALQRSPEKSAEYLEHMRQICAATSPVAWMLRSSMA